MRLTDRKTARQGIRQSEKHLFRAMIYGVSIHLLHLRKS